MTKPADNLSPGTSCTTARTSAVLTRGPVVRPNLAGTAYEFRDVGLPVGCSVPDSIRLAVSTEDVRLLLLAGPDGGHLPGRGVCAEVPALTAGSVRISAVHERD